MFAETLHNSTVFITMTYPVQSQPLLNRLTGKLGAFRDHLAARPDTDRSRNDPQKE